MRNYYNPIICIMVLNYSLEISQQTLAVAAAYKVQQVRNTLWQAWLSSWYVSSCMAAISYLCTPDI